jgi:hypothetical protein
MVFWRSRAKVSVATRENSTIRGGGVTFSLKPKPHLLGSKSIHSFAEKEIRKTCTQTHAREHPNHIPESLFLYTHKYIFWRKYVYTEGSLGIFW